jgi:glycosyltransferase involved in cell wall biosynthesis
MKYSIITINFNHRDGLRKTIESVIIQSCKNYEFIVIDGGSTDGSREFIEQYSANINYWVSEPDKGIYNAMNKGIKAANGEYLIFMNSGDTFYDEKALESSLPYMNDDIVQGIAKNQDMSETPLCLVEIPGKTQLFSPSLHHQSCFFRKKLFEHSLYDENYKIVADWKFYIEQLIFYHCTFLRMPVKVAIYEGGGISDTSKDIDFEERKKVIAGIEKLLKEKGLYDLWEKELLHVKFTTKQRFLINKSHVNVDKFVNTFPESSGYYVYYPFSKKQRLLFFLANHRMSHLIKVLLKAQKCLSSF